MKVLLLTHPDLVPPEGAKASAGHLVVWRVEFDLLLAMRRLGHEARLIGVYDSLKDVRKEIESFQPDIAFNLVEEFDGVASRDHDVVRFLEKTGLPYTGCDARGLVLSRQKGLTKRALAKAGLRTPDYRIYRRGARIRVPDLSAGPWFIKSLTEEASLGISQNSIVSTPAEFRKRVRFVHKKVESDVLAEKFIEGKELYVGVLGNEGKPETLPVWQLKFLRAPRTLPRIATRRVKFNAAYQRKYGITSGPAQGLTGDQKREIQRQGRRIYEVLGLTGYARLDFRMTRSGDLYFLEANPNPHFGRYEDFAQSAMKAGHTYASLVERILRLGLSRQPRKKLTQ